MAVDLDGLETVHTRFLTMHAAPRGLHLRCEDGIFYVDGDRPELMGAARALCHGQGIRVSGRRESSRLLRRAVFVVERLEPS